MRYFKGTEALGIQLDGTLGASGSRNPGMITDSVDTTSLVAKSVTTVRDIVTSSSNAVALDVDDGAFKQHTLTENTTFGAPSNASLGDILILLIKQDTGNSYTYDLNSTFLHSVTAPVTVTADKRDSFIFLYDGGNWNQLSYNNDIE